MLILNELISLHVQLIDKCRHNQKIVLYQNIPLIVNKNYGDLIADVIFNRGV